MDLTLLPEILGSTIRMSVPLILACLAGLWSERSGIVDIGLEGKMLAGAFAAASAAAYFHSPWIGLFFAILVSLCFSLVHGYAAINQRGNQVVSGVAINMLAAGLTVVIGNSWFKQGGRTPQLDEASRFLAIDFPGKEMLLGLPSLGPWLKIAVDHSVITYVAVSYTHLTLPTILRV